MQRLAVLLSVFCLIAISCSTSRPFGKRRAKPILLSFERSEVFSKSFSGFLLVDAQNGREICAANADHYFTPASNVKILTLATCLKVLGDSLPRFRFDFGMDSSTEPYGMLFATGTGDPTTLHPDFAAWQAGPGFKQLHQNAELMLGHFPGAESLQPYGPGWMWDDLSENYSTEISELPLYGNTVEVHWNGAGWTARPAVYQQYIVTTRYGEGREYPDRYILLPDSPFHAAGDTFRFPMYKVRSLLPDLLHDTFLNKDWDFILDYSPEFLFAPEKRWYACPSDTAYRRMMYQSDNFFAEQLLLLSSGEQFDTLNQRKMIKWMKDSVWTGIPDQPRWVDGSGLSRYNLCTPRFFCRVLEKLWMEQSRDRLFDLFPAGGSEGTLTGNYAGPSGKPFLYAKSGSMSGVYCLSGYLVAKSGRVLIFSCMNNNFIGNNQPWKNELEKLLIAIYERY